MKSICVFQDFLTEAHKKQIREAAEPLGFTPHFFTSGQLEQAKACLQDCEILYGQDPELLRAAPASLKWYCTSTAGVDVYCQNPDLFANPDCMLTNSNCYGVTIAEHVIMVTLMLLRRMTDYLEVTRNRGWSVPLPIQSIRDNEFTLLGMGNIGFNVAERLRGMGAARIVGLSRSGKARENVYDETLPISQLDQVLPRTRNLIMALPGTAETVGILNRERLALLPKGAYIVNVGRGSAIDQQALMDALNSGHLGGAALDVMEPEPLPKDHPLWETRNLLITPHVSGNMSLGYTCDRNVEMFCEDLKNYAAGRKLNSLIDRSRGY